MGYDVIMNFPSRFKEHILPEKLHQINVSFVVDSLDKQFGGTAMNIAYSAAIFKGNTVKLFASVGKDGSPLIDYVKRMGVLTEGIITDSTRYSATGTVITDNDDNQIWGYYYGACEAAKSISLVGKVRRDSLLVISANHPEAFVNFQHQAIAMGIDYMYDPGMTLSWNNGRHLREGVKHCTWLVGNDYEIARIVGLIGMTVEEMVNEGVKVITTLGAGGVRYQDKETDVCVPAYKVQNVVDPTGAGDAWRAGFITGIVRKLSVKDSLCLGNAMASFAVEMYGTANHTPTEYSVLERAKSIRQASL